MVWPAGLEKSPRQIWRSNALLLTDLSHPLTSNTTCQENDLPTFTNPNIPRTMQNDHRAATDWPK